jgi:putative PIN family toxin of toxin-antitoxin system
LKAVFDTHVLIPAFVAEGVCTKLLRRGRNRNFSLVICPFILQEFQRILNRKFGATRREIQDAVRLVREAAQLEVQPSEEIRSLCRDPDDDQILACAVAAGADYLVTGGDDLLVLNEFREIRIRKPKDFGLLFED